MAKSNVTPINSRSKTIQGASKYTERKELELYGVTKTRITQLKGSAAPFYHNVLIADVFSGTGINSVESDTIAGSPIRILDAVDAAIHNASGFDPGALIDKSIRVWFSDIRQTAINSLNDLLSERSIPEGMNMKYQAVQMDAASAIEKIQTYLDQRMVYAGKQKNPKQHHPRLILVLDPNGPKQFPRDEVLYLLKHHSPRVDLIPYISATAVNRCINHRDKCDVKYNWWLSSIEGFDTGFVFAIAKGRPGWIRLPIPGDTQKWLMMPSFSPNLRTHNAWEKQGFVMINSKEGIEAIKYYAGERSAV